MNNHIIFLIKKNTIEYMIIINYFVILVRVFFQTIRFKGMNLYLYEQPEWMRNQGPKRDRTEPKDQTKPGEPSNHKKPENPKDQRRPKRAKQPQGTTAPKRTKAKRRTRNTEAINAKRSTYVLCRQHEMNF